MNLDRDGNVGGNFVRSFVRELVCKRGIMFVFSDEYNEYNESFFIIIFRSYIIFRLISQSFNREILFILVFFFEYFLFPKIFNESFKISSIGKSRDKGD